MASCLTLKTPSGRLWFHHLPCGLPKPGPAPHSSTPMPRSSTLFVCRECGSESLRWAGRCPHCGAWNTLEEFHPPRPGRHRQAGVARHRSFGAGALPLTQVDLGRTPRLELEWQELNRVLGGGVVPGSVVLVGGEPGVGKSTLLLHVAAQAVARGGRVLYASGEESVAQVGMRAHRLGLVTPDLLLLAETDLDAVVAAIEAERPVLAVVDSIQTLQDVAVEATAGSVSQVRESAARLLRVAKQTNVPIFLVGHVTKEGVLAGPRVLEHVVDVVLALEGERGHEFRVLRAHKNRFGSTEEIGIFTMGERGLSEVGDPGALLVGDLTGAPGTAVAVALEGSRPLLVELQALVAESAFGVPRRVATGLDLNRLHMIVAVLERRARIGLARWDVLANVAGGIRVQEPAVDLGLALAIAGSRHGRALPRGTVVVGEVGLAGEVRRVARLERRLQEAARRGFARAVVPRGGAGTAAELGLEAVEVGDVGEAVGRELLERPGG